MNQGLSRLNRRRFMYYAGGFWGTSLLLSNCSNSSNGALMDKIRNRGQVIVGTEAGYEPYSFIEDGQIVGFSLDLVALVVEALGIPLEMQDLPFEGILPALLAQKVDFVIGGFRVTPELAKRFAFSLPVAIDGAALMKRKGDERIKSLEDISGKVVGVLIDSPSADAIAVFDQTLKASGQEGIRQIKDFKSNPEEYLALTNEQVDVVTAGRINLSTVIAKQPEAYELIGEIGESEFVGWLIRPENKDFRDVLNQELQKLLDNGELARLQEKWFGFTMDIPTSGYLPSGAH